LEIAGADGTLTADGSASLDGTSLALNLAAAVPEIAPLTASLAGAVGGRLAGKLHVTRAQPDPQLHFAGTADLSALHAPDPTAALLGPTVHASAEGALDGGSVNIVSNFRASRRWPRWPASIWRAARRSRATLRGR
jgi:hypothetical protein